MTRETDVERKRGWNQYHTKCNLFSHLPQLLVREYCQMYSRLSVLLIPPRKTDLSS